MQQQPQKDRIEAPTMKESFNVLFFAMKIHWATIAPFLHVRFGPESLSWSALFGFVLLFFVAGGSGEPAMWVFSLLFVVLLLVHRVNGARLRSAGFQQHSQDCGYPWLAMLIPGIRTVQRAMAFEILICFIVGALLLPVSQVLGAYVMLGGISMGFMLGVQREVLRRRQQQVVDAEMENRAMFGNRNMQDE